MQGQNADVTKMDDRDYRCVCHQCGQRFEAVRSDATFCSARCRVAFSREPKKLENAIDSLTVFGQQVLQYGERYKRNERMYQAMLNLQRKVNAAVAAFECEQV